MIKLTIDNSECKIEGLSIAQHKELAEALSYVLNPQARFFGGGYGPKRQTLLSKKGVFPTGLLYVVKDYLNLSNQPFSKLDIRRIPEPITTFPTATLGVTPYPQQKAAAEAVKQSGGRGIIVAPTGTGKSLICTLIIQELKVKTLVIVPSLELKRQLTETLKIVFGNVVGKGKLIYVENVDSVKEKDVYGIYEAVIIDEFHHSGAKTYRKLNKKALSKTYYKIGLTATAFRSQDNEKLLLESVLSNTIYEIRYQEAVDAGFIVPLEAYYVELPKVKTNAIAWQQVYLELIVNNEKRNDIIADILKNLDSQNRSALALVKEVKHGENIQALTDGYFAHGVNEDTPHLIRLFNERKLNTLIGTTGVLGEGIDTKPAEFVIVCGLGKSKNSLMQQFGRTFRRFEGKESAKIILFLDRSHKFTRDHFKAQCKVLLDEYNIIPIKLEL